MSLMRAISGAAWSEARPNVEQVGCTLMLSYAAKVLYDAARPDQEGTRHSRRFEIVIAEKVRSPFNFAVIHAGLGDQDAAFEHLEAAYQQRVFGIIELTTPMFDRLRFDPRSQDLVRRVELPQ
jgi:hypothetical protein